MAVTNGFKRVGQRLRLFEYFLKHVMAIRTQLHAFVAQFADMHWPLYFKGLRIKHAVAMQRNFCNIALFQIYHVSCHRQQRRHIGSNKIFMIANAQQQWTAFACAD